VFEDLHELTTRGREPLVSLSAITLALVDVLKWTGLAVCKDGRTGGLLPVCK